MDTRLGHPLRVTTQRLSRTKRGTPLRSTTHRLLAPCTIRHRLRRTTLHRLPPTRITGLRRAHGHTMRRRLPRKPTTSPLRPPGRRTLPPLRRTPTTSRRPSGLRTPRRSPPTHITSRPLNGLRTRQQLLRPRSTHLPRTPGFTTRRRTPNTHGTNHQHIVGLTTLRRPRLGMTTTRRHPRSLHTHRMCMLLHHTRALS